ncbi:primosomal replication protein N [Propionivibrio sp.]|uniref:primosomal replication protein N n=1 Tax=Propionivibrio sp. TaxID=2212460 RepID=UPI0025CD14A8|nr:primosomal replication protein N [Propionivibrio sp.]MBK7356877.1 primosomal replication protein N [Propionivibrio sp.]MBK8401692.1 primosomal replication protein N [Propionivibrio sp.]MBK8745036.1 primosomal replication protein N [Propionivibrio sp.]MBK8893898.1 primosomal replication protein N [Propionivibrio sp.]MBL0208195.1 primosomal replication protein N [Propionivibrio sp.]
MNRVELTGILIERKALRYTPASVPVTECVVRHQSDQIEADRPRRVECEIRAIGLGDAAKWLQAATPGAMVHLTGFMAASSRNSKQLRLHVITIEFVEGNENG